MPVRKDKDKENINKLPKSKKPKVEKETPKVFADPTYDPTFKMLFGSEKNKVILINFLNNILGFKGKDEIKDLEIKDPSVRQEDLNLIEGAVDVRCKLVSGEEIAIEMQRRNEEYFLSRTQDYMAKLIGDQVMKDESKKYHIAINKTYMVIISKARLFVNDTAVAGDHDTLYEKTVVPMIKELNMEVPHNKMYWKFFELPRFEKFAKDKDINMDSPLKEQWLNFLVKCHAQEIMPENVSEIIKAAYEIMKMANWTTEQRQNYELTKIKEAYQQMEDKKKAKDNFNKGKLKGEIKGEISKVKDFIDLETPLEKIIPKLKFLTHEKIKDKLKENLKYIETHPNDYDSDICDALGLVSELSEDPSCNDLRLVGSLLEEPSYNFRTYG